MRRQKMLCLGILFFVLVRQGLVAQCGQTSGKPAVSTASADSTPSGTGKEDRKDRIVDLQLTLNKKGSVSSLQILSGPNKLRVAAAKAAKTKYMGRNTWPMDRVEVRFPRSGHGAPEIFLANSASGVPGCVIGGSLVYIPWPSGPGAPPFWLFNTQPVIPVLAASASETEKRGQY
jgi:hypothetical protein